jgi:excisionase family DNA binding protein
MRTEATRASRQEVDQILNNYPTCSVDQLARMIGCGRTQAYGLVNSGEIRSIKIGNRHFIPTAVVRELLQGTDAAWYPSQPLAQC